MTTAPRWPRRLPSPALAELRELTTNLPALAALPPVERYRAAAVLVATLPRVLRAVRDEAAVLALQREGMTYRSFAAAVGLTEFSVNKRVNAHNARQAQPERRQP